MNNQKDGLISVSDSELLIKTKSDIKNFSLFYKKYYDKIYKYCYIRLGYNQELAQDCTSDTFLKSLKAIQKVSMKGNSSLLPWFYTIARNEVIQKYRTLGKQKTDTLTEEILNVTPDETDNTHLQISNEYEADKILTILNSLSPIAKEIVYLKIYNELSFIEIAQIVNLKESAVKMQYYRSIENVTNILKNSLSNIEE